MLTFAAYIAGVGMGYWLGVVAPAPIVGAVVMTVVAGVVVWATRGRALSA